MELLGSHMQNAAEPVQQVGKFVKDSDPENIGVDNFAYGGVEK